MPDTNNNKTAETRNGKFSPLPRLSSDDPAQILNRGANYLRDRLFHRSSTFESLTPRKSALEVLSPTRQFSFDTLHCDISSSLDRKFSDQTESSTSTKLKALFTSCKNLDEERESCVMTTDLHLVGMDSNLAESGQSESQLRQTTPGKRRMSSSHADDLYSGMKQRQRLGSEEIVKKIPPKNVEKQDKSVSGTTDFTLVHNISTPPVLGSATASWPFPACGESMAFPSTSDWPSGQPGFPHCETNQGRGGEAGQFDESFISHCLADSVKSMDIQSNGQTSESSKQGCNPTADDEISESRCGEMSNLDMGPPDSTISPVWRRSQNNLTTEMDLHSGKTLKADESSGARALRQFKIASRSGSRPDLINRIGARNSADMEMFFNEMGMEGMILGMESMPERCDRTISTTSLNFLENISSVGTPFDSESFASEGSQMTDDALMKSLDLDERPIAGMSVVERNARIIKWLCSVRKVTTAGEDVPL